MNIETLFASLATIVGALCVAGIAGLTLMYRQVGELRVSLEHISESMEAFVQTHADERKEAREDRREIHKRIDEIQERRRAVR